MAEKQGYAALRKRFGNNLLKSAQAVADDTQFEQDFSKIAFSFIQDKAPGLMKYLLGFETVDRDEDGSRAVGIFGFKVGNDYYYVPAFFLNNQVKGVDMILNKRTNSFVPLTEEWVDEITRRQHVELGSSAPEGVENDFEDPDFDFLQHPDNGPLSGHNVKFSEVAVWSLADAWEQMKLATKEAAKSDPEFNEAWAGFVGAVTGKPSEKRAESADLIKGYIRSIGGPKAMLSTLGALENFKYAEAAMRFYNGLDAFMTTDFDKDCYLVRKEAEAAEVKVRFTTSTRNDDEARNVVEDGFTVIDKRKDDEKSIAYTTEFAKSMSTPDGTGIYDVLMPGGDFERGYVLTKEPLAADDRIGIDPDCVDTYKPKTGLVYFPGDKRRTYNVDLSKVFVKTDGGIAEKPYDKAKDVGDIEQGSSILLVGPDNTYIGPVDVQTFEGGKDRRPSFHAGIDSDGCWGLTTVEFADFNGRPKASGNVLTIPADWKFLELYKRPEKKDSQTWHDYDANVKSEYVETGSSIDLFNSLTKNAHHFLHVNHKDGKFRFELDDRQYTEPVGYKQASIDLVTRLGLGYDQAKRMLKVAERTGGDSYIVKFAQMVGVNMPQPGMPDASVDPYTGMPVYPMPYVDETQGQMTGVPEGVYENVPGENVGGELSQEQELPIDQEAQMLAQQAAELGQKNVFDQATVGGLSKVYDTGSVIDSYIPQFMESLDRLGRVIFLYYWKHDDFITRYGTEDVVEMEDLLRSAFKTMGKLTIELKRRGITGDGSENTVA